MINRFLTRYAALGRFPIRYAVPAILLMAFLIYIIFFNLVMMPIAKGSADRLIRSTLLERMQNLRAGLEHAYQAGDEGAIDKMIFYANAAQQSRRLFVIDQAGFVIKAHRARFAGGDIALADTAYDQAKAALAAASADINVQEVGDGLFAAYSVMNIQGQKYILYLVDDYSLRIAEITRLTTIPETIGAGLLLVVVLLLGFLLYFTLTGRLNQLTQAANAIASGQTGVRAGLDGADEIAQLGRVFDTMAIGVDKARLELEHARTDSEYANRAKSDFLANMSHEIRTPLTGVLGMLEALKELKLTPEARRFAVMANKSAFSLLDLVNDILDFSRLEAGKKLLRTAPMNIATMVRSVHDALAHQAVINDLDLDCEKAMSAALWIEADEKALKQILMNFVNNAIKFTRKGSVKVSVEAVDREDGMIDLNMSVTDTGDGIEEEDLVRLFERFEQVEEFKHSQKGTGLGLAICRELIRLMKGKIWAESKVGKGSIFHISVPVSRSDSYVEIDTLTNVDITSFKRPLRVLAVDDNQINRTVIYQIVSGLGLKTFVAEDGANAIEQVKRRLSRNLQPFDIILMDIHMPDMDGLDTMDHIRKLGDWAARVPIIALTAHAFSDQRAEFLDRGMVGYVSKPIDRNALALEIAKTSDKLNLLVHKQKKTPLKKKSSGRITIKK